MSAEGLKWRVFVAQYKCNIIKKIMCFLFFNARYTLSTSNSAIAALLCALYPHFPAHSTDNRWAAHTHTHTHRQVLTPASLLCVNAAPCAPATTCRPCATWLCWLPSPASWSRWMWTPWSPATPCWRSPTRWAHLHTHTQMFTLSEGQLFVVRGRQLFYWIFCIFKCLQQNTGGRTVGNVLVHVHVHVKTRKMTAANMQLIHNYELDNELWQNILGLCCRTGWCALNNKADGLPYYRWRHSSAGHSGVRLTIIAGLCLTFSQSTERLRCFSLYFCLFCRTCSRAGRTFSLTHCRPHLFPALPLEEMLRGRKPCVMFN